MRRVKCWTVGRKCGRRDRFYKRGGIRVDSRYSYRRERCCKVGIKVRRVSEDSGYSCRRISR